MRDVARVGEQVQAEREASERVEDEHLPGGAHQAVAERAHGDRAEHDELRGDVADARDERVRERHDERLTQALDGSHPGEHRVVAAHVGHEPEEVRLVHGVQDSGEQQEAHHHQEVHVAQHLAHVR